MPPASSGKKVPATIPVQTLKRFSYQIRMAAVDKLKLPPPLSMFNYAELALDRGWRRQTTTPN